ncbi:hypothetical protein KAFR_0F00380 [Kazachstania africana CBS 2517]|uniref:Protein kinase domain-containing protein n=1 Tax=Kazachstania africana (strain ATCC 22294 / BCRC 22015 / CBS 2517 / CECT 1963 / NBRC 1671 / NRRL Y-8276) TaxID=1071382 RepID=H2AW85_KAZAF|nr:hypothetical protein KAFR_0F00380 [Kazachstania africana CBS 2517]CCF58635.1 hypothetical protein KAFR_0F00380 [Kazachstania africana CBS 2517]
MGPLSCIGKQTMVKSGDISHISDDVCQVNVIQNYATFDEVNMDDYNETTSSESATNISIFGDLNNYENRETIISVMATRSSNSYDLPENMSFISSNVIESPSVLNVHDRFKISINKFKRNLKANSTKQRRDYLCEFNKKYKVMGSAIGSGSGGEVKMVKNFKENKIFAMKQFHPFKLEKSWHNESSSRRMQHNYNTCRYHLNKIRSEYCISKILDHENIIKTVEIMATDDTYLTIMEYMEFDLFAIVMSKCMSYNESCCYFKQLLNGVMYLHELGIAHRDLKLDNLVINNQGILKIIDFGAAVVFKSPFNDQLTIMAKGVLGSDPYLSPECYIFESYDPRAVDVWSCGIVFTCMRLHKFPWKYPQLKDLNFQNFCMERNFNSLNELVRRTPYYNEYTYHKQLLNTESLFGPMRLLGKIDKEAQPLILQMLEISPHCRPSIDQILSLDWIQHLEYCTDNKPGLNHTHTKVRDTMSHIGDFC